MDSQLASAVIARRRELGLTQLELADLAGTSERFVHALERGKATARLDKVLDVLRVLGLGLAVQRGDGTVVEQRNASSDDTD
ncbi:MAG: type II toxin-antitoxin system Y4mF family antitoxin [Acidimicrobiia bacterium]